MSGPSLETPPKDGIFVPGRDPGLQLLKGNAPLWTEVKGAKIKTDLWTDNEHIIRAWRREQRIHVNSRRMDTTYELGAQLAVVEDIAFPSSFASLGPRWFFNGVGGQRLWVKYYRAHRKANENTPQRDAFSAHFTQARAADPTPIAETGEDVRALPYVIDARNLWNYYHFMSETFCHLALLDDLPGHKGEILIHCPQTEPKPYVMAFLEALFPDLVERVRFVGVPHRYGRALTAFVPNYYLFQAPEAASAELHGRLKPSRHWNWDLPEGPTMRTLWRNAYMRSLRLLRERAARAIEGLEASHLPKRAWITRKATGGRDRSFAAEADVERGLHARGFETLSFEDLPPLEQIALMYRAEAISSYHGAGFTNLIYAGRKTQVIELGTLQSGVRRLSDFMSLAHVSGCRYTVGICDSTPAITDHRGDISGKNHHVAITPAGLEMYFARVDQLLS
ncbi:MAG: glycosyltransferase family 61 protein [Pseudomonadota bacterium]